MTHITVCTCDDGVEILVLAFGCRDARGGINISRNQGKLKSEIWDVDESSWDGGRRRWCFLMREEVRGTWYDVACEAACKDSGKCGVTTSATALTLLATLLKCRNNGGSIFPPPLIQSSEESSLRPTLKQKAPRLSTYNSSGNCQVSICRQEFYKWKFNARRPTRICAKDKRNVTKKLRIGMGDINDA